MNEIAKNYTTWCVGSIHELKFHCFFSLTSSHPSLSNGNVGGCLYCFAGSAFSVVTNMHHALGFGSDRVCSGYVEDVFSKYGLCSQCTVVVSPTTIIIIIVTSSSRPDLGLLRNSSNKPRNLKQNPCYCHYDLNSTALRNVGLGSFANLLSWLGIWVSCVDEGGMSSGKTTYVSKELRKLQL